MTDLRDFIAARLEEDEAAARAATPGPWHWSHDVGDMCNDPECPYGQLWGRSGDYDAQIWDVHGFDVKEGDKADADHIARHDPARVLREVKAKRAILAAHADNARTDPHDCIRRAWYERESFCWVIQQMAAAYNDHSDYQPGWEPEAWPDWVPLGHATGEHEDTP